MSGTGKGKRTTSYDVARIAGVSQATVSLVLNHKGTKLGISAETEARVKEVARQLRYYPNSLIRSVQRGRTGIVGVYGRDQRWNTRQGYWIETLGSLHTWAAELTVELLIFSDHPKIPKDRLLERMLNGVCDGIVVQPGEDNSLLDDLIVSRLPIVCIGDPYLLVPTVGIDNRGGIRMVVEYLASKGHRNLAMLNLERAHVSSPYEREQAYLSASSKLGLNAPPESIFHCDGPDIPAAVRSIMAMDPRPTAVVCFNDDWAYQTIRYCLASGIRVPEDLAITGFDGIPVPLVPLQATTVRSPIDEMCHIALEKLLKRIEGEEIATTILPVELVPGETA